MSGHQSGLVSGPQCAHRRGRRWWSPWRRPPWRRSGPPSWQVRSGDTRRWSHWATVARRRRQTDTTDTPHSGQYHYHGNINCTQAGAATGAADPDTCKLIGYYRDGVPVYGFCKDTNGG